MIVRAVSNRSSLSRRYGYLTSGFCPQLVLHIAPTNINEIAIFFAHHRGRLSCNKIAQVLTRSTVPAVTRDSTLPGRCTSSPGITFTSQPIQDGAWNGFISAVNNYHGSDLVSVLIQSPNRSGIYGIIPGSEVVRIFSDTSPGDNKALATRGAQDVALAQILDWMVYILHDVMAFAVDVGEL
ncbi:hypothetical protein OE88DRAFT_1645031 [Heliocybe sulcata]|uniref:Uncharacterized protein n=1 Tax=Heliocybe sulcata TaxID=5364 RepID=A0A5C3N105_9AGAM|nr:hypothetical protein OE88DRAFT_1645031 [Heliocybe sulcata]